jgi:hypothetical protein
MLPWIGLCRRYCDHPQAGEWIRPHVPVSSTRWDERAIVGLLSGVGHPTTQWQSSHKLWGDLGAMKDLRCIVDNPPSTHDIMSSGRMGRLLPSFQKEGAMDTNLGSKAGPDQSYPEV